MTTYLKQSTAATIVIGPIVDSVDASAETGQTITQTDVLLWKQGGTGLSAKNDSTSATHRSNGLYTVPLDATDTATLGQFVNVAKSGTLVYRADYEVVPANVWDSLFGADFLWVDVAAIDNSGFAADVLSISANTMISGTSHTSGGTSTEFSCATITEATADHYKGRIVIFTGGALAGQATAITAYALASGRGTFTCNTLTESVPNSTTFIII